MGSELKAAIEAFLRGCREPVLLEPGEELLALGGDSFALEERGARLTLQAWDRERNLVRRVTGIREQSAGRLELVVERFARKEGRLFLLDRARPAGHDAERRGTRLVFQERFRQFLRRQFLDFKLAELSTSADLEHSLSPVYPRALLKRGQRAWAALAAPPGEAEGALSFGLIWLDYLRQREPRLAVEGLALYLAAGEERTTCLRAAWLDAESARLALFAYSPEDFCAAIDARDFGNLDTRLEVCRRAADASLDGLAAEPGVERVERHDGAVSFRVRGVEFAQTAAAGGWFGLRERHAATPAALGEIRQLAAEVAARRSPEAPDREDPLYRMAPEAWLESQVRARIQVVDATLRPAPVYGQVPAFAGGERGVMDLLAVDHQGRLAVLELKASQDLHLPLQALDYWMRVKWHLDRDEFRGRGYFPETALRREPPRLLLVSPALEFHPASAAILSHLSPQVDVTRIGLGVEWRRTLAVMFRLRGSEQP